MSRNPHPDILIITAYITLAGVTVSGILGIDRITVRWGALILLFFFGLIISRYPPDASAQTQQRRLPMYVSLQTLLVTLLLHGLNGGYVFAILFYILSATIMLYKPLRHGLLWISIFTIVTASYFYRTAGWQGFLQSIGIYIGGYLFFGMIANALQQTRLAQVENLKLLQELRSTNRRLQDYANQVQFLAAAEERNRLSREMHDTIGHQLTVAAVQLEAAQRLIPTNPEKALQTVNTSREQVRIALHELRQTVGRLRSPLELELSLPKALQRLASDFQAATNLQIHLDISGEVDKLSPDQKLVLYRVTQEGLTNIQKHAQAHQVWIQLIHSSERIQLSVIDDGIGFSPNSIVQGFGLQGLRERAARINGEITTSPRHPTGNRLMVNIPTANIKATPNGTHTDNVGR